MKETDKLTIKMLAEKLLALADSDFAETDETFTRYAKATDSVEECERMANILLISPGGRCDWENIAKLKSYGFDIYAGEKDSFGWLTGCIGFSDGERVLVYG